MKLIFTGHNDRYAIEQDLLAFFPTERPVYDPDAAEENGTGSNVRVLIESSDGVATWTTVGVSYNIIEASLEALADAVTCKLYKTEQARWRAEC